MLPQTRAIGLHLRRRQYESIFIQMFVVGFKNSLLWNRVNNARSRWSKAVDFGTNRKRVCNLLLVINSNLPPVLPRFRDIAGFLLKTATPPLFHSNLDDVSLGLDCPRYSSEERTSQVNYVWDYFRRNPTYTTNNNNKFYLPERNNTI